MPKPQSVESINSFLDKVPIEPCADKRKDLIESVFNEHNETLLRFLLTRLQSESDAHEVAQEAYVRLLNLDDLDTVSYLQAYLFKIANNIAIDRLRSKQRFTKFKSLIFVNHEHPSEEEVAMTAEKVKLVTGYINELPPKCREAFLLSRFNGLGTEEIAKMMHLSSRMVRKYLVRATEYCCERLDEEQQVKDDA